MQQWCYTSLVSTIHPRIALTRDPELDRALKLGESVLGFLAVETLGWDRFLAGDGHLEVGFAAGVRPQAQAGLDQDDLRIPGNGLVMQGQAGFFIAEVQGLRLRAIAVHDPQVMHCPVAPALDQGPHRGPPTRKLQPGQRGPAGKSSKAEIPPPAPPPPTQKTGNSHTSPTAPDKPAGNTRPSTSRRRISVHRNAHPCCATRDNRSLDQAIPYTHFLTPRPLQLAVFGPAHWSPIP